MRIFSNKALKQLLEWTYSQGFDNGIVLGVRRGKDEAQLEQHNAQWVADNSLDVVKEAEDILESKSQ